MSLLHTYSKYFFKVYRKIKLDQEYDFLETLKTVICNKNKIEQEMLSRVKARLLSLRNVEIMLSNRSGSQIRGNYFSTNNISFSASDRTMPNLTERDRLNLGQHPNFSGAHYSSATSSSEPNNIYGDSSVYRIDEDMVNLREQIGKSTAEIEQMFDESFNELGMEDDLGQIGDAEYMISQLYQGKAGYVGHDYRRTKSGKKHQEELLTKPIPEKKGIKILDQYISALSNNSQFFSRYTNPAEQDHSDYIEDQNSSGDSSANLSNRSRKTGEKVSNNVSQVRSLSEQYKVEVSDMSSRDLIFSIKPENRNVNAHQSKSQAQKGSAESRFNIAQGHNRSNIKAQTRFHPVGSSDGSNYSMSSASKSNALSSRFSKNSQSLHENQIKAFSGNFEKNLVELQSGLRQFEHNYGSPGSTQDQNQKIIYESNQKINSIIEHALNLIKNSGELDEEFFKSNKIMTFAQFLRRIGFTTPVPTNRLEILLIRMLIRELYLSYVYRMYILTSVRWEKKLQARVTSRVKNLRP